MRVIHDGRRNYVNGNYYMTTVFGSEVGHFCLLMKKTARRRVSCLTKVESKILLNDKNDTHTHKSVRKKDDSNTTRYHCSLCVQRV